jgi:hypothetical protein
MVFMKKLFIATLVAAAAALPLGLSAQAPAAEQLAKFMATLQLDGIQLGCVHLNDRTVALLFQPPTLYAMRARAKEATALYCQGVAEKDFELDTTTFTIEQEGTPAATSTPTSIHNFTKGKVKIKKGDRVDGVLTFDKLVNLNRSFILKHGKAMVEYRLADVVPDMTAPPAPAPK